MSWFSKKEVQEVKKRDHKPNPHAGRTGKRNFFSADAGRLLPSWTTQSVSIDQHLRNELTQLRARGRELSRVNPFAKKFAKLMVSNIVGPNGVGIDPQSVRQINQKSQPDTLANNAIQEAFRDWSENHCDYSGMLNFVDIQGLAVSSFPGDGEFIFEEIFGKEAGKYGYQLRAIDPELLDVSRNQRESNGNITRLGVEKNQRGKAVRYWFREEDETGNYSSGRHFTIEAKYIIHCFLPENINQSRGIPWMNTGVQRAKMIEGYEEAALVAARTGAAKMGFFSSPEDSPYEGEEEDDEGNTITSADPGTFEDIGNRQFHAYDPRYPHEQYPQFMKQNLQAVSSGWGVSYASLSNSLEGVNYSSIRAGVMDDREMFKLLQNWFIRCFVSRVYQNFLKMAIMRGEIKINNKPLGRPLEEYQQVKYQPKRWAWVDPLKDMQANKLAVEMGIRSPLDIMQDEGRDPEKVLLGFKKYVDLVKSFELSDYIKVGAQADAEIIKKPEGTDDE